MKKIVCISGIVISLIVLSWMPAVVSEGETSDEKTTLYAIGIIRINSQTFEINGFVLFGVNGDQLLTMQRVEIQYDGTPIWVTNPLPMIFIISYNPA